MAPKTVEQNQNDRDEVLAILLDGAHTRTIRAGHRLWASGELLSRGVTRAQFEASIRALDNDFKVMMQAKGLWRFLNLP